MTTVQYEAELDMAFRFDAPIEPSTALPRWRRKQLEQATSVRAVMEAGSPLRRRADCTSAAATPVVSKGDRFIPQRSSMNFDMGHYTLTHGSTRDESGQTAPADARDDINVVQNCVSPGRQEYQKSLSQSLFAGQGEAKILALTKKAPAPREGYQNNLRVLYSQNRLPKDKVAVTRRIPLAPESVLDAPSLRDDYYLNLLEWSTRNMLAIALDESVYLWNATSGKITHLLQVEGEGYVASLSWIGNGTYLAVGTDDGIVQLWDVDAQKQVRRMAGHDGRIAAMAWNQHILSSGAYTGRIHDHDVRIPAHHVGSYVGHDMEVCGLKWSQDGSRLASGGNDNLVNIWSLGGYDRPSSVFNQHQAAVKALAWCPWQSSLLATGGGTADRHMRFWNVNTGVCLNSVDTKSQVCAILWNEEHRELVSSHGFSQNQLTIWKYPSLVRVAELMGHKSRVLHLAMSPDGQTVCSAAGDQTLRMWKCFASEGPRKAKAPPASAMSTSKLMHTSIR